MLVFILSVCAWEGRGAEGVGAKTTTSEQATKQQQQEEGRSCPKIKNFYTFSHEE